MKCFLTCCLLVLLTGCADEAPSPATDKSDTLAVKDTSIRVVKEDTVTKSIDTIPANIQVDSVIHLLFAKDSTSITVKGHLGKDGDPVICYLPVAEKSVLTAILIPDKKDMNIRFSHIYLPDGTTDGPFGQKINYKLRTKGIYKLYIGVNLMAGDGRKSSDFTLQVKLAPAG